MPDPLAHICHLTVLNPAVHTRIFYKLACSQQEMGYQVSIIGQDMATLPYEKASVSILPTGDFPRKSFARLFAPIRILRKALQTDADIYVIHTPELLWVGAWLKKRKGKKVVYDVHEDYLANITQTETYPKWMRGMLGRKVRRTERRAVKWLDAISYAELNYDNLLEVPPRRKFFLRNTFTDRPAGGPSKIEIPAQPYMLYTGTLSENRGVFRTLALWAEFNKNRPVHLVIAGMAFLPEMFTRIWHEVEAYGLKDRFTLIGGIDYLPFTDILRLIEHCEFGTALYDGNLRGRMPTKFYEFMAYRKALVYTPDSYWDAINSDSFFGFSYQQGDDPEALWKHIHSPENFPSWPDASAFSWKTDEKELKRMLETIG